MLNVLISYPSYTREQIYLPYIFGLLKTFCDRDPDLAKRVNWLMPVYGQDAAEAMLEGYDLASIDVLGLSCYSWNWFLQRELAGRVRRANPDCLTVAGGPHCDYEDPGFFDGNPWLDVVVKQDGQVPFREILHHQLDGEPALTSIPGLYLPGGDGVPTLTSPPRLLEEDEIPSTSPYQEQSEYFEPILEDALETASSVFGVFETNRGCPYHCSFCDWGSLTFSSVRQYPMSRVKENIRWLIANRVPDLHLADANVGIFERDVEIIDFLGRQKQKHGTPRDMIYSPTKSRATYLPDIMRKTFEYNLKARACLPLQHTDPEVLEAMDRKNLRAEEIDELLEVARSEGIPIYVHLIQGSPYDTYEKWKQCFADLMARGIDGDYFVMDFELLPNAPAARREYMEEWGIDTTTMKVVSSSTDRHGEAPPNTALRKIITSTDSFDEDDWCRMGVYTHAVRALHCRGTVRGLAHYLHYFEGVSFRDFYDGLIEELGDDPGTYLGESLDRIRRAKHEFLDDPTSPHQTVEPDGMLPEYDYRIPWRDWLFMKWAVQPDLFFHELREWLLDRFALEEPRVLDLLRYQRQILVTPDYDAGQVKRFRTQWDWKAYFERSRNELQEAPERGPWEFVIRQEGLGPNGEPAIEWDQFGGHLRREAWFKTAVRWAQRRPDSLTLHRVRRRRLSLSGRILTGTARSINRWVSALN